MNEKTGTTRRAIATIGIVILVHGEHGRCRGYQRIVPRTLTP